MNVLKLLMVKFCFRNHEVTWEKYMGDWKELDTMTEQDDLTLHEVPANEACGYNYDNFFTIAESKRKLGNPDLNMLINQLSSYCEELESYRGKPCIGYFANSAEHSTGYTDIHGEDVENLESLILGQNLEDIADIDFILSSPGGLIEASLKTVEMIRMKFSSLSFLLCGSTYSAAVLMSFCGDEIIMQSFAHLAPINPKINGFDTYVGKKVYRTYKLHSIFAPWSVKYLAESKIAENGVTLKTIHAIERMVYNFAINGLSKHLFKIDKLSMIQKIKTHLKIKKIVNFFFKFENHNTHVMPFYVETVLSVGLPVKKADPTVDMLLRKIRYICHEITTTEWRNDDSAYYIRKIYFSPNYWRVLHYSKA